MCAFPWPSSLETGSPWRQYRQIIDSNVSTRPLILTPEKYKIMDHPVWTGNVVELQVGNGQTAKATPLIDIDAEDQDEEIKKDDTVLFLGSYIVVLEPGHIGQKSVNFMKLTSLTRKQKRRRGGGNDEGLAELQLSFLIRGKLLTVIAYRDMLHSLKMLPRKGDQNCRV